jgi:hypothetical protein
LGEVTEPLHLEWYRRKTGRSLSRQGEVVIAPRADWAACTLDAWDDGMGCPVEVKHVGGREPREGVITRYQPQLHWQMLVTGARKVMLSLIEGANEPVLEEIGFDEAYGVELWHRAEFFMECVATLTLPVRLPAARLPTPHDKRRRIDLDRLKAEGKPWPNWAASLEPELKVWRETHEAAKTHGQAVKRVKDILPENVGVLRANGVIVTRARNGAVSIRLRETRE